MNNEQNLSLVREWYRLYAKLIFSYVRGAVDMDADTASEIVQETFCAVLQKQQSGKVDLEEIEHPKAWLIGVAKNTLRDWARERNKRSLDLGGDAFSDENLPPAGDPVNLELEYRGLVSDEDLRLLIMMETERRTCREASELLGITAEACKKRRQRARLQMREQLEET